MLFTPLKVSLLQRLRLERVNGNGKRQEARGEGSPSPHILGRALQKIHLGAPSFELERSPSGMVLAIVPEGKQGNRKHQQSQRGCAHLDDSSC